MVKLTAEYERAIAMIADLHIASIYGLNDPRWLPSFYPSHVVKASKQLYSYWVNFTNKMRNEFNIDTVMIVGDVIAGSNPKEFGVDLLTPDLNEQVELALKLLTPLCKGLNVHVWSGSPYHDSLDFKTHKVIAESLNGVFHGPLSICKIKGTNKNMFVAHDASLAPVYPETIAARDLLHMFKAEGLQKIPKINIVVRAHRHISDYKHKRDKHIINLPCWCCFTPLPHSGRKYFLIQPDVGGALLLVEKRVHRIRVIMFDDYPLPHIIDYPTIL